MKKISASCLILAILFVMLAPINAEEQRYSDYTVLPIFPDSQISSHNSGYFNLLLEPKAKETLKLEVVNTGNEEMIVHLEPTNGVTRDNGESDYTSKDIPGALITDTMTSLLTIKENDVVIKPKESLIMEIDLKMPDDPFTGIILGGIAITATNQGVKEVNESGVGVTSSIRYLLAIQVQNSVDPAEAQIAAINSGTKEYLLQPAFYVSLQNQMGLNMSNVMFEGVIKRDKDGKEVATVKKEKKNILPYSDFDVVFETLDSTQRFGQEVYLYELDVMFEDQVWKFSDTINMTENQVTENSISNPTNIKGWYIVAVILIISNIVLLSIVVCNRKKTGN